MKKGGIALEELLPGGRRDYSQKARDRGGKGGRREKKGVYR